MFMQFTGCHQPVQGFYWPENAIVTGWENANNMRNVQAHKIQWSGSTVHFFTVVAMEIYNGWIKKLAPIKDGFPVS